VYRDLLGKREGKRLLGRQRRRWQDNIKTDLQENKMWGIDWICLAQDRDRWRALVTAVMNFWLLVRFPVGFLGKFQVTEPLGFHSHLSGNDYQGICVGVKCGRSAELTAVSSQLC
jgi:hypothetical protein